MKTIATRIDQYRNWVGKKFTCPTNGNTYEVEQSDISSLQEVVIGFGRDDTTAFTIKCPCGGRVYFTGDGQDEAKHVADHSSYSYYDR